MEQSSPSRHFCSELPASVGPAQLRGSGKSYWHGFLLCKRFPPKPYTSLCCCWFQRRLDLAPGVVASWLSASAPLLPSSYSCGCVMSPCRLPLPWALRPTPASSQEERSSSTPHPYLLLIPGIHGPAKAPQLQPRL